MSDLIGKAFVTFCLIALTSCTTRQGIQEREPDYLARFPGSPEAVAKCIANERFNQTGRPLVISTRNGLVRISNVGYGLGDVPLTWELTLRPDGVAEVRGFPTIWGWAHGEDAIPLVEKCGKEQG